MANKFSLPNFKGAKPEATEPVIQDLAAATAAAGGATKIRVQQEYKSNRGRRIMAVVLILLLILLLLATLFLYNMVRPKGDIATSSETGGIEWVRSIYGVGPAPTDQLSYPASVAVRNSGDILTVNTGQLAVMGLVFNESGVYADAFAGSADTPAGDEGVLRFPTFLEVAPDGKIYVLQRNTDQVLVLSADGKETINEFRIEEPTAIDVTEDRIAVGSRAGWVVTDLDFNPLVGPVGTLGKGEGQYDGVTGVKFDEDNNLYVVDTYNNRISKFDEAGEQVWQVVTGAAANDSDTSSGVGHTPETDAPAALGMPVDAELDNAGRLLVIDTLGFQIAAFDPETGEFINKWGEPGNKEGEFLYPASIAYDSVRDWVVVADMNNNRLQIIRIPGSGGGVGGALARALAGPLRACFIPLILLLIALIVWLYLKWRERRENRRLEEKAKEQAATVATAVAAGEIGAGDVPSAAPDSPINSEVNSGADDFIGTE